LAFPKVIEMSESSDTAILDLLRQKNSLTIAELAGLTRVTSTAVRQRLSRLMSQGLVERELVRDTGRGRPSHKYLLTQKGKRKSSANFVDLALVLWQEIRAIDDPGTRRGLLKRLAHRMAEIYGAQLQGTSLAEKMQSAARLFGELDVPFEVDDSGELPVLTAIACPYPDLAEQDRGVCALERMMLSEMFGSDVRLDECRLDGHNCCTFIGSELATS
jgi:predicted ArsR family transcriptional regulator